MTTFNSKERHAPLWRVLAYIKDPLYGSNVKRKFVEIKGFKNVSTSTTMSGGGSATVTFPDHKSSLIRFISYDSIIETERENVGLETTNSYVSTWLQNVVKDSSSNYFKGMWNDTVVSRGDVSMTDPAKTKFIEYSRSRGNLMSDQDLNAMKSIRGDYASKTLAYTLPFLDIFDPIFIDSMGQDGFWYAEFTGFITRIQDSYARTGVQDIQVSCKDMSVLLDNISLVTGWNRLDIASSKSTLNDYVYATEANQIAAKQAAYSNIFADPDKYKDVKSIILDVIKRSQDMWAMERFGQNVGVKALVFDTEDIYAYTGISGRRGSVEIAGNNGVNMDPELFKKAYTLTQYHYMLDTGEKPARGKKKIFMDPMLLDFDNLFIHKTLSNGLALYKDSMKSADSIIADIVAKIMAYRYFDGNGNLIIECSKLNALPNLETYGGRSNATALRYGNLEKEKTSTIKVEKTVVIVKGDDPKTIAKNNGISVEKFYSLNGGKENKAIFKKTKRGTVYFISAGLTVVVGETDQTSYSDPLSQAKDMWVVPKNAVLLSQEDKDWNWATLLFHGKNYVMSNDDFVSFTNAYDEAPLYTVASMDAVFPMLENIPPELKDSSPSLHGVAVADYDKLAKIGVRRYQTQSIYNIVWPKAIVGTRVLSYMAATVLERANAQADSGTMILNHRPDIQLGRTYINLLRMKSYLITAISNSWSAGGVHTTTLTLTFGHPIHKTLSSPWAAIFVQPEVFGFENGVVDFDVLKPVTTEGNERTLSEAYLAKEDLRG